MYLDPKQDVGFFEAHLPMIILAVSMMRALGKDCQMGPSCSCPKQHLTCSLPTYA